MNINIIDSNALHSLPPLQISGYIKSNGGTKKGDYRDIATVWEYKGKTILIHKDKSLSDYGLSVKRALETISEVENRSQFHVYKDISTVGFDVIRVKNNSTASNSGTYILDKAINIIENSQNLIESVACSASTGKLSYTSRKPQEAEQFMRNIRMGQTEHGSFVLTFLSPVTPSLVRQIPLSQDFNHTIDESYEEKVIPLLGKALHELPILASSAFESNDGSIFLKHGDKGITSNLCDSIVGLQQHSDEGKFSISISFSKNRAVNSIKQFYETFDFDETYIDILKSASSYIKSREPLTEQVVRGIVINLHREANEKDGIITIFDNLSKNTRSINIELQEEIYNQFAKIHSDRSVVEVEGTIRKKGNKLFLDRTSEIKILSDPKDD